MHIPFNISEVILEEVDCCFIEAVWHGHRIGKLKYWDQSDEISLLGDVWVEPRVLLDKHKKWWSRWLPTRTKESSMRGRGVGSLLVKDFLRRCTERGIIEVFGNVTPDAHEEQPFLSGWYQKMGFVIRPSDGRAEFFPIAYKIVWKR